MAPDIAEGIVLEEEVILAFEKDEAVWIIGPVLFGREVDLRAVRLLVSLAEAEDSKKRQ
jgi:hypothetical protein